MKWLAKARSLVNSSRNRSRGTKRASCRPKKVFPWLEVLESRLVPSTANIQGGVLEYTAAPNEVNNVTISPVVFGVTSGSESNDVIITDPNAVINVLGGTVATDWLKGLNISLGAGIGFDAGPVEVSFSVSFGFPLIPAQIPGGAVLAPFGGGSGNIYNTIIGGLAQTQNGAAVVASSLPSSQPGGGNVFFQVGQNGQSDTITNYQLYQAAIDPSAVLTNVSGAHSLGGAPDLSGSFANFSANNHAHFVAVADQLDTNGDSNFYKIHLSSSERVVVIMDNDPTNSGTPASTRLALLDSLANTVNGSGPNDSTAAVNLSAAKGNAVGSEDLSPGDYYLQVSNFGFSTKTAYRFIVLAYDTASPQSVSEPGNGVETSTTFANAQGLGAGKFGTGAIAPLGESDTWSTTGNPNDLVFAYADTHSASGSHSLNSTLSVVAHDQTTTVASATEGGPPGANPKQIQNVNSTLAGVGLSPTNSSATSMNLDFTRTVNAATVNVAGIGANVKIVSGAGGVTATLGTGTHNTFMGDTSSGNTDTLINNSNSNNETAVYGGAGHNVLIVQGDQSSNNFILAFKPAVVQANATKDGYTFANGYEELDVTVDGTVSTYLLNLGSNGLPDLQEVQVVGDVGHDNLTVLGHALLAQGISFDGKGGQNTLIVHDGDAAEAPGDTKGHLDILRLNRDATSGSIAIGSDAPVVFTNVQTANVTPFVPLLNSTTSTITGSTGNDHVGRLVVLKADPFEPNDGILNATDFNFLSVTNLRPNIDQPNAALLAFANQTQAGNPQPITLPVDQDWYRFQAPLTSTFTFAVAFDQIPQLSNGNAGLPANGELDADVFDGSGNLVASGIAVTAGKAVTISALQGQTYYLRVRGHQDNNGNVGVNNYTVALTHELSGPQVQNVYITGRGPNDPQPFNLFGEKPTNAAQGPTPLVNSLTLSFVDQPVRAPGSPYPALDPAIAANPGEYLVVGDNTGVIPVSQVLVNDIAPAVGQVATATVTLVFAQPLPDDRYTVTIQDSLVDPSANPLAGGSNANQPNGGPTFPSGQGNAAANFVARFTVNSRPTIAVASLGTVYIDLNHNGLFDPVNKSDQTNADKAFAFGLQSDAIFAGRFTAVGGTPDGFSKLGAYGQVNGVYRWLLDFSNKGTPNYSVVSGIQVNGLPVAGHFDQALPKNTDQIGLFDGNGTWYLDTNGNNNLDSGDLVVRDGLRGIPIIGDFDGNGFTDLATYRPDTGTFYFDFYDPTPGLRSPYGHHMATLQFSFPGKTAKPVAADMIQDGVTDVGLYVTDTNGTNPGIAQWYFLVSQGKPAPFTVNTLSHAFDPVPFGSDLFAQFGVSSGLPTPIVGLFDPPIGNDPVLNTPDAIAAVAGTPQNAQAGHAYSIPFQVRVTNSAGLAVSGATVTFQTPPNGPGGTFAGNFTAAARTDLNGVATAPTFTANSQVGTFNLTATVADVGTSAVFDLRNTGKPAAVRAVAGSGQTAVVGKGYGTAVQAKVTDAQGNPVSGVSVTFAAPATGPGGTFAGQATVKVLSGQDGIAKAPAFTANTHAGSFTVTAAAAGAGTASFNLTNQAGPAARITAVGGTPQNAKVGGAYATPLQVQVTDAFGNLIKGASVIFKVVADPTSGAGAAFPGSTSATVKTDLNGLAMAPTLTANAKAGSFTVEASVTGITGPAVFHLQNRSTPVGHALRNAFVPGM